MQGKYEAFRGAEGKMSEAHEQARLAEMNACKAHTALDSITESQSMSERAQARLAEVSRSAPCCGLIMVSWFPALPVVSFLQTRTITFCSRSALMPCRLGCDGLPGNASKCACASVRGNLHPTVTFV